MHNTEMKWAGAEKKGSGIIISAPYLIAGGPLNGRSETESVSGNQNEEKNKTWRK